MDNELLSLLSNGLTWPEHNAARLELNSLNVANVSIAILQRSCCRTLFFKWTQWLMQRTIIKNKIRNAAIRTTAISVSTFQWANLTKSTLAWLEFNSSDATTFWWSLARIARCSFQDHIPYPSTVSPARTKSTTTPPPHPLQKTSTHHFLFQVSAK